MLFNSLDFAIFLPIVFGLYWFVFQRSLAWQNALVVVASYVFYGWWDPRFLLLILFSTLVDYLVGIRLSKEERSGYRRGWLILSMAVNLGLLGFFKYYHFFVDNFVEAFTFFGFHLEKTSLEIILPVGISFYTFQTMSYSIDVYRRKMPASHDFIAFSAFVSFFPQLVAGPIERASHLLPQFMQARSFSLPLAKDGLRQMLWGLFKKIVIADNCATFANDIFNNSADYNGSALLLGALFFSFQIYGDFSGYSDIAIGCSRLFGFDLMRNFAYPYFARDIAEFWRRWHISLSTWFRDYLYIPLGGSQGSLGLRLRNTWIVFLVSGFWHGPNWTFLVWGALHAIYFMPLLLANANRRHLNHVAENRMFPSVREAWGMASTFFLVMLAWVFFRAASLGAAFDYLRGIFSSGLFSPPNLANLSQAYLVLGLIAVQLLLEWITRQQPFPLATLATRAPRWIRWGLYYAFIFLIIWFGGKEQEFIYFQF